MIIYGSRMYFTKNVVKTHQSCPNCGKYGPCRSYDARKFGHLYFIPLIPEGGRVRVSKECPKCKQGQHMPLDDAAKIYSRIEALLPPCLEAAAAGKHEFVDPLDNEPLHTGPVLADAVDTLLTTGHSDDVPGILEMLRADGAAYEAAIVESVVADAQNRPKDALPAMLAARDAAPDQVFVHTELASFARRKGSPEDQLAHLQDAAALTDNDPSLLLLMIEPLETLKRFDEMVEVIDNCIAQVPELTQDKKFMKLRKKYAKKTKKSKA